jgi:hypothetical protein
MDKKLLITWLIALLTAGLVVAGCDDDEPDGDGDSDTDVDGDGDADGDGDGDADTDADGDGDGDADGDDECDPIHNDGCDPGERCGLYSFDGLRWNYDCLPEEDDTPGPGEECIGTEDDIYGSYDNCEGGSICMGGEGEISVCYKLCSERDASPCAGVYDGEDGLCLLSIFPEDTEPVPGILACMPATDCNPQCDDDCPTAGDMCLPASDRGENFATICIGMADRESAGLAGDGFAGDECSYSNSCQPGHICWDSVCTTFCDTDNSSMPTETDLDADGIEDDVDNCPELSNPDQMDTDTDGEGDACDNDIDGDEDANADDNCVYDENPEQEDADDDGIGDACQDDHDGDTVENADDNCPEVPNTAQADADDNGIGDACDDPVLECAFDLCGDGLGESGDEFCHIIANEDGSPYEPWDNLSLGICTE